jgi:UDP-glucose 4-epimerase
MNIFVTGAAGFIGSVVTEQLIQQGHQVLALDNLSHGHRAAVHPEARFAQADLLDAAGLKKLLAENKVDAVVHLAAEALIDESIRNPGRFYQANVVGGMNLLDAMVAAGVKKMIFSSTAAVYGEPEQVPISEDARLLPVNSYGESKLAFERMLVWYRRAFGIQSVSLRYFNACGATERFGEDHQPETHIIPSLFQVALGKRPSFSIYGSDYPTPDSTCIRDYVHVVDIALAHILALQALDRVETAVYNLGHGSGYSNQQVIDAVRRVTGQEIPVIPAPRRPGDPARLVASSQKVRLELGWEPRYPDLEPMIQSAWDWQQRHPEGYGR